MNLIQKTNKTKEIWSIALKQGNIDNILKCYSNHFIFKGTLNKKPTICVYDMKKYFKNFLKETTNVTFFKKNEIILKNNLLFDTGRYNFKTIKGVIKAQYFIVFDEEGKILIHHSTFY